MYNRNVVSLTKYVALLRGINPLNPNMRNEKLRGVFESLGFTNVQTVLTSGNVLFKCSSRDRNVLEDKIEKALFEKLGFKSTVIIRSWEQLSRLTKSDPFKGEAGSPESYLNVTFLKRGGEVFSSIDIASTNTSNVMRELEKEYGKEITTRTGRTVVKIVKRLGES